MKVTFWLVLGFIGLLIGLHRAYSGQSAWIQIAGALIVIFAQIYRQIIARNQ